MILAGMMRIFGLFGKETGKSLRNPTKKRNRSITVPLIRSIADKMDHSGLLLSRVMRIRSSATSCRWLCM